MRNLPRGLILCAFLTLSGFAQTTPAAPTAQNSVSAAALSLICRDAGDPTPPAFYADSEGHVIHYDVTTPDSNTLILLSNPPGGPRFRLVYRLEDGVMTGKFQVAAPVAPPGTPEFKSYLEWSGKRQ